MKQVLDHASSVDRVPLLTLLQVCHSLHGDPRRARLAPSLSRLPDRGFWRDWAWAGWRL